MRVMESGWPLIGKLCLVPVCMEERCVFSLQFPAPFFLFLPPKHKAHGVFHLAHPSTPPELGE